MGLSFVLSVLGIDVVLVDVDVDVVVDGRWGGGGVE